MIAPSHYTHENLVDRRESACEAHSSGITELVVLWSYGRVPYAACYTVSVFDV
jgi:hypothetical protein